MNRRNIGRVLPVTIAVVLLVLVSSVVALSAKPGNPFDQILAKLDDIAETLKPQPATETVTLASAPVALNPGDTLRCTLANVGTETVEGMWRLLNADGEVLVDLRIVVPSGHSVGYGAPSGNFARCEFVINRPETTVRAYLQTTNASGVSALVEMR